MITYSFTHSSCSRSSKWSTDTLTPLWWYELYVVVFLFQFLNQWPIMSWTIKTNTNWCVHYYLIICLVINFHFHVIALWDTWNGNASKLIWTTIHSDTIHLAKYIETNTGHNLNWGCEQWAQTVEYFKFEEHAVDFLKT